MARSKDPNSAGSQFFIVVKDYFDLDGQYTVFGKVLSGMVVADQDLDQIEKKVRKSLRQPSRKKIIFLVGCQYCIRRLCADSLG